MLCGLCRFGCAADRPDRGSAAAMRQIAHLFSRLRLPHQRSRVSARSSNYIGFRGDLAEPDLECSSVREWLDREGPIDLAVLGLGVNGHLGFNEPGASLLLRPHAATLSEASRDHGMVSHRRSSIIRGITLGVGDLMAARRILLLVSGERKADQLAQLFAGSVTTQVPATLLNVHSNVGCYCDKAAAMRLPAEVTSRAG